MARRSVVDAGAAVPGRGREAHPSQASVIATEIKGLLARGERDQARERFGALVALLQRRALRVAFQYLRNPADADEAVQDAFIKVFLNLDRYREDLAFDTWFTRILVNASLDRLKARSRQQRFIATPGEDDDERMIEQVPATRRVHGAPYAGPGAVAAGLAGGGRPARPSAAGVHAQPGGRADAGRNRLGDGHVRRHGSGPFVSGTAQTARYSGGTRMTGREGTDPKLAAALDAYRAAAHAEADAHFDERALETQRQRILQRIEQAGHRARVLHFPTATTATRPSVAGVSRRWIAPPPWPGSSSASAPVSCCT